MAVVTQKRSVPSLLARPAGKGCPRKRERERGVTRRGVGEMETEGRSEKQGKGLNERREKHQGRGCPRGS